MPASTRRSALRLEAFDDRCLPSVTAVQVGDTLQVQGDAAANVITITDNVVIDTATGEKGVVVSSGSQTWAFGSTVARIQVFTFGGDDTVNYSAAGVLTASRTLTVDLGAKNDTFTANLDGLIAGTDVDLIVQASGQDGADTFRVSAQNAFVGASASLAIDLQGGKGRDSFSTNYAGVAWDPTGLFLPSQAQ